MNLKRKTYIFIFKYNILHYIKFRNTFFFIKNNNKNFEFSRTHLNVLYKSFFDSRCDVNPYSYDHCEPDKGYERIKEQHRELYKKFERNLKLITNKTEYYKDYETDNDKLCFYLKYWFYDQLFVHNFRDPDIDEFLKLWNERKGQKCANCQCEFNVKIMKEIKILKNIYDYFLFLDAFKDRNKISTEISKRTYCKYVHAGSISRSMYVDTCASKTSSFCKEFNNYIKAYVELNENSSILCQEDASSDVFHYDLAQRLKLNMKFKEEEEDKEDDLVQEGEKGVQKGDSYPSLPAATLANSISTGDVVGQNLHLSQEQNAQGDTDLLDPYSSNDGKSTGTIISASSVGTVGFLFLLYKVNIRIINKYEYYRVFFQN
ncbi:hypothetical protein PVBG_05456 [Plasmodium vivax Brazil I]|uniref:Uncharacterized protein n=1 Tax=Plasmodium vivax (strain Brazil I) TaxID=1033975 RepID=A0A0J9SVC7_PLAV1|nr:hypothetical protein PVBG_05456 [Plasmodium vivax Brazil I]